VVGLSESGNRPEVSGPAAVRLSSDDPGGDEPTDVRAPKTAATSTVINFPAQRAQRRAS
jgi:hypothetical protein